MKQTFTVNLNYSDQEQ
jgi:hypothetical protein